MFISQRRMKDLNLGPPIGELASVCIFVSWRVMQWLISSFIFSYEQIESVDVIN